MVNQCPQYERELCNRYGCQWQKLSIHIRPLNQKHTFQHRHTSTHDSLTGSRVLVHFLGINKPVPIDLPMWGDSRNKANANNTNTNHYVLSTYHQMLLWDQWFTKCTGASYLSIKLLHKLLHHQFQKNSFPKQKKYHGPLLLQSSPNLQMWSAAHHCQWQRMRRMTAQHKNKCTTVSATCQNILNSGNKQVRKKDSCGRHLFQKIILMHPSLMHTSTRDALWIVDPTGPSSNWKLQSTMVHTHQLHSPKPFGS